MLLTSLYPHGNQFDIMRRVSLVVSFPFDAVRRVCPSSSRCLFFDVVWTPAATNLGAAAPATTNANAATTNVSGNYECKYRCTC